MLLVGNRPSVRPKIVVAETGHYSVVTDGSLVAAEDDVAMHIIEASKLLAVATIALLLVAALARLLSVAALLTLALGVAWLLVATLGHLWTTIAAWGLLEAWLTLKWTCSFVSYVTRANESR
jgi:hypothetical protein